MDTFERAFEVFIRGFFSDPNFPAWGVLEFPLAPCPDEMLPFDKIDKKTMEVNPESSSERTLDREASLSGGSLSLVDPGKNAEVAGDREVSSSSPDGPEEDAEKRKTLGASSLPPVDEGSPPIA